MMSDTCRNPLAVGYYALTLCILKNIVPEQAIAYIETGHHIKLSEKDVEDMRKFKKSGMSYRQIGEMYGITHEAVYGRLRQRKKTEKKVDQCAGRC